MTGYNFYKPLVMQFRVHCYKGWIMLVYFVYIDTFCCIYFMKSVALTNELQLLYFLIKSRRMRWAGHVARMGRRGTLIDYWWGSQKEGDH
jgi:hypothetical protein